MTTTPPEGSTPTPPAQDQAAPRRSRAASMALYLAIGALIAAAALGGYFIIVGDQANVAGRAWMTLLLVGLFAGAVVLDANLSNGPNRWYLGVSTLVNVVLVAIGLIKLWNGWLQPADTAAASVWVAQFGRLLLIVILFRLALLFTQLYGLYFVTRARSSVGRILAVGTIVLVWATALVLAIPAAFPAMDWPDWWWRIAGATALVAVVTTVIPLILRAFDPNRPKPQPRPVQAQPTYQPAQQAPVYYGHPPVQQAPPSPYGVPQQPPAPPLAQPPAPPAAPAPAPAAPAAPVQQPPAPAVPPVQAPPVPPVPPAPGAPTPPQ